MSDYDHMTNADVISAAELAEYDRDAEFRLDAADEARDAEAAAAELAAADGDDADDCGGEFIDGVWYGCGACDACASTHGAEDGYEYDELAGAWF
ncbi:MULTISPECIES: hypothetical protein [unclassified Streptomyces]|uniref:hypothetical protein n=1 Tax=unclassified Streptomyces TaxID=2593676 RepID=UPI0036E1D86E